MRINVAVPETHVTRPVLDAALEATTRLDEQLIKSGKVPQFRQAVNRVRWRPEPPGDEHFDHAGVVLGRGWGDCDDLAPWHAASLRATGEDPGAKAFVKRSGPKRWHAVVQRSDGTVDDPSREAGMGQKSVGVLAPGLPIMLAGSSEVGSYIARPQLALRPVHDRHGQVEAWQARADLPWHWMPGSSPNDIAMASLHASPESSQAVVGAIEGLLDLGEANDVPSDVLDRASAVGAMVSGYTFDDVAREYGEDAAYAASNIVGSFFGNLVRAVTSPVRATAEFVRHPSLRNFAHIATSPVSDTLRIARDVPGFGRVVRMAEGMAPGLLERGLQFIPGVGPIASQAFHMASPMLQRLISEGGHLPPSAAQPPQFSGYPGYGGGFPGFGFMPGAYGPSGW